MPLHLNLAPEAGGPALPQLRYMAQAMKLALSSGGSQAAEQIDPTGQTIYIYWPLAATGWIKITTGMAPVPVWNESATDPAGARPNPAPAELGPDGKAAFSPALAVPRRMA